MKYYWNWYRPIHQELINPMDSLIFCRLCSGFSSISAGCEDLRSWKERGADLCGWEPVEKRRSGKIWRNLEIPLGDPKGYFMSSGHFGKATKAFKVPSWMVFGGSFVSIFCWDRSFGLRKTCASLLSACEKCELSRVKLLPCEFNHVQSLLQGDDWLKGIKICGHLCLEFLPMVILICRRDSLCLRVPVRQTLPILGWLLVFRENWGLGGIGNGADIG